MLRRDPAVLDAEDGHAVAVRGLAQDDAEGHLAPRPPGRRFESARAGTMRAQDAGQETGGACCGLRTCFAAASPLASALVSPDFGSPESAVAACEWDFRTAGSAAAFSGLGSSVFFCADRDNSLSMAAES